MNAHDDLMWLAEERPAPLALDEISTARARAALMNHMEASQAPAPSPAPRPVRRAERRWLRPSRVLAMAAVGAVGALGVITLVGTGDKGPLGVSSADAAPLVKLADEVSKTTALPGDATLIERHHTFPGNGAPIDGFDLYLDDGTYYYADTRAGLPDAIRQWDPTQTDFVKRAIAVALDVPELAPEVAIERMADAELAPGVSADAPPVAAGENRAKGQVKSTATPQQILENHAWTNSLDTMIAGGSRPDVRAGVLELLSNIPSVSVEETELNGRPALELTSRSFSGGYTEQLTIDADSGIPLRFVGAQEGAAAPSVVITYTVTRVSASEIAKG
jgi:hypothetical protein